MSDDRADAHARYLQRLGEEIERRRSIKFDGLSGDDERERLLEILREMGERLRLDPDYVELTQAELRGALRQVRQWFREHDYPLTGG